VKPFRLCREFRAEPNEFWRAIFDPGCMGETYDRVGVQSWEILDMLEDDATIRRTIRAVPARDVPGFLRAITGASLAYEETTTYFKGQNRADLRVTTASLSNRIDITATYTVTAVGAGRLERVLEGEIDVRVPVVGPRIERAVLDDNAESYEVGAQVTQNWLDRNGLIASPAIEAVDPRNG